MTRDHASPGSEISRHPPRGKDTKTRERKIDKQVEDSFPASDPPSYAGGNHMVGGPDREGEYTRRKH